VDQLEEQLGEFRERENSTRLMYDKIITTLNDQQDA